MNQEAPEVSEGDSSCHTCGKAIDEATAGFCPSCLFLGLLEPTELESEVEGHELLEELGRGGMGVVVKAREIGSGRLVALKRLTPHQDAPDLTERFLQEMKVLAELDHPAILPLYHSGEDINGRPFFSMKLALGGTLAARRSELRGNWREIAKLTAHLAAGLHHAHSRGVIHRDLKPLNILFDEPGQAYVADFGLAKWSGDDAGMTQTCVVMGTPAYMSPEVAEGGARRATMASDVYSLGTILYWLLVGHAPFSADSTPELMRRIAQLDPVPPQKMDAHIPASLSVITLKALQKNPVHRYQSAAALADDLQCWLDGFPIHAKPATALERLLLWSQRNPALAAATGLLITGLTVAVPYLWHQNTQLAKTITSKDAATADSMENIEFMLEDMRTSLESIGRLDFMDKVLIHAEKHFQAAGANYPDTRHTARHSLLYTQWAETLRARGRIPEAKEQAAKALKLADARHSQSSELSKARIKACRVSAELELEVNNTAAAAPFLNEAAHLATLGETTAPTDGEWAYLAAKILEERLDGAAPKPIEVITAMEAALQRATAQPGRHLAAAKSLLALCHYYRGRTATETKDHQRAYEEFDAWRVSQEQTITNDPGDAKAILDSVLATQNLAKVARESLQQEQRTAVLPLLEQAAARMDALIAREPGNLAWQSQAAATALEMMLWNLKLAVPSAEVWREKMLSHIQPVLAAAQQTGNANWLLRARNIFFQNAASLPDTASAAQLREAMDAALLAYVAAATFENTEATLGRLEHLIGDGAKQLEAQAATAGFDFLTQNLAKLKSQPTKNSIQQAIAAILHRRLADRSEGDPRQAWEHNFSALTHRLAVMKADPQFPKIQKDVASALNHLAKTPEQEFHAEPLRRLLPPLLQSEHQGLREAAQKAEAAALSSLKNHPPPHLP